MPPEDNDPIKSYMREVGQSPLLSREEENRLAACIARGCEESRQTLITCNLRLVVKIAHDYKNMGLPLLDLIAEGNVGLMQAVEKFDPGKGAKFSSYASWWIKHSMRRALSNQSRTVRIPAQSISKLNNIQKARQLLLEKMEREPTEAEIAEQLGISEQTVSTLLKTAISSFSLQECLNHGEFKTKQDVLLLDLSKMPDIMVAENETTEKMLAALQQLDEREQTIIVRRFGLDGARPWTLDQLAGHINRSRERVRQIQFVALAKLKSTLDGKITTSAIEPTMNNGLA